ncbi:hypothetical protein DFH08DRAFT_1031246 [Mycena albidolilacea]|uniref:Uncharacterized protein n=1 Tax=Mycena albidolilacea TaxID=1033008 RepID=A0AAD7AJK5_9AGAR|nr:hypothetical protein DFH08DRAFT_1031246 [Mycena albidolilacea]
MERERGGGQEAEEEEEVEKEKKVMIIQSPALLMILSSSVPNPEDIKNLPESGQRMQGNVWKYGLQHTMNVLSLIPAHAKPERGVSIPCGNHRPQPPSVFFSRIMAPGLYPAQVEGIRRLQEIRMLGFSCAICRDAVQPRAIFRDIGCPWPLNLPCHVFLSPSGMTFAVPGAVGGRFVKLCLQGFELGYNGKEARVAGDGWPRATGSDLLS